jgi:porin
VLRRIIERFFPGLLVPTQPLERVSDTWSVYYNFDQFLWSPAGDPARGIGPFFRFGLSDGIANPIKYAYNVGVGGVGIVPGRPRDSFGVGWARTEFSDHLVPFLRRQLGLGLEREDAVEMYYNAALTPWLGVTLDLQIVEPALQKTLGAGGQLKDVDTVVVGGLRIFARF